MDGVVILSGGMDSTTLLHDLVSGNKDVVALSFDYGQRHRRELLCASKICADLGVDHQLVDISAVNVILQGSSLTQEDIEVPEGHYAEDNMKATVVPNRNMILLSLAIGYAISKGTDTVFYGAHAGDHDIYPDCRKVFVEAMGNVAALCHFTPVFLKAPYQARSKGDVVSIGIGLGVPYVNTHTCYNGMDIACGRCGCCVERIEAFMINGEVDPIPYVGGWDAAKEHVQDVLLGADS